MTFCWAQNDQNTNDEKGNKEPSEDPKRKGKNPNQSAGETDKQTTSETTTSKEEPRQAREQVIWSFLARAHQAPTYEVQSMCLLSMCKTLQRQGSVWSMYHICDLLETEAQAWCRETTENAERTMKNWTQVYRCSKASAKLRVKPQIPPTGRLHHREMKYKSNGVVGGETTWARKDRRRQGSRMLTNCTNNCCYKQLDCLVQFCRGQGQLWHTPENSVKSPTCS